MKRFLSSAVLAIAAVVSMTAFADGIDTNAVGSAGFGKLTESQKAEILKQVAAAADTNVSTTADMAKVAKEAIGTPQKVSEWVDVGTKIGQGLGGAAKELGVAVNDFVKTPVGEAVMAIFIWKFMGAVIMHAVGALLVMITGFGTIYYYIRRAAPAVITYDPERKTRLGKPVIISKQIAKLDDGYIGAAIGCSAVVLIMALITMFTY